MGPANVPDRAAASGRADEDRLDDLGFSGDEVRSRGGRVCAWRSTKRQIFLRALKQDPETKNIPVVVLSGLPRSNEAKLLREGAVSYLERSRLEDPDALLDVDHALRVPRHGEFCQ